MLFKWHLLLWIQRDNQVTFQIFLYCIQILPEAIIFDNELLQKSYRLACPVVIQPTQAYRRPREK